jgi:putative transposase
LVSFSTTETLSHTRGDCKYHLVFIPKYRRKALYTELRRHLGEVFRSLAEARECRIEEGHLLPDHVHRLRSIPPQSSVAQVVGFIKGQSALHMARTFMGRRKNYTGHHCWARGYDVSTVGRDEATIREYLRTQEAEDRRLDQRGLWSGCRLLAAHQLTASSGARASRFERFPLFSSPRLCRRSLTLKVLADKHLLSLF